MTIMQQALAAQHLAMVEKASRYQTARAQYLRSAALDERAGVRATVEISTLGVKFETAWADKSLKIAMRFVASRLHPDLLHAGQRRCGY